ncbi:TRAP transporter substrate-binding protein [Sedimentibacter hydroxybenzoicus DSM 7310]|uniref:TRAP transporter substrate-binding protein n=1 Tax=Sedimentibacter hydroxybenzoicus DSM 7310 TaxID=1123245 RepID=A0A974GUX1_SEDHY|nr:TRAP transporter substrate-binding protein [Sedimentibacter hydroxybenzoicus]NYB72771.1 TRAP transporter substrate-binding protein [Sedimentibacter hydroxybenzoicus DSM 7310]
MKKILSILMAIMLVATMLTGCGGSKDEYTIKVASILADNDPETLGLKKFKELVESRSDGKIVVELYPNAQLGSADTYLDTLRQGTIQMASPGSVMAQLQRLVGAPEMPFLFRDWDHAKAVLTDEKMTDVLTEGMIENLGIRTLGFAPRSFRVISSNKELNNMNDLKGLRIRVPNIPFYIKLAEAIGTSPVALPLTELFSSLEQGVVEAQENPYATIETSKYYEIQDYILETNHIFTTHGWYMNEKFFQSLPQELQEVVINAANEAISYTFDINIEQENNSVQILKDAGIKIVVPDEAFKSQLVEAAEPSREFFYNEYPGSKEWAEMVEAVK